MEIRLTVGESLGRLEGGCVLMDGKKGGEMEKKKGAVTAMDEEIDAIDPEMGQLSSKLDVLEDPGLSSFFGGVITEFAEDERGNGLRPNQCEAAALVAMGLNDTEVGRLVGVSRQTVNVWKNHNGLFMEAVRERRAEIWDTYKVDFRLLVPRAIEALGRALDSYDERMRLGAARFILRTLSLE